VGNAATMSNDVARPAPRGLKVQAWAKLRGAVRIMIAVPGNFAHPKIGFTESIH
jgi:hypothetical protein